MTALSDSVSTTLKFSIVAVGRKVQPGYDIKIKKVKQQWSDCQLTLPVQSHSCVPEVMAHLMPRHAFHNMCSFQGVQHNAILLHFSPVHLLHTSGPL